MVVIVAVVWGRKQISDYFNILSWFWTFMGTFSVHLAPVNPGWHLEGKNVISNRTLQTLNFQTGNFPPMEYGDSYNDLVTEQHEEKEKNTFRKPCFMTTAGHILLRWFASVLLRTVDQNLTRGRLKSWTGLARPAKSPSLICHWALTPTLLKHWLW